MNIDDFTDEDRAFVLQELNGTIDVIMRVLKKRHPDVTEENIEYWLKVYLNAVH